MSDIPDLLVRQAKWQKSLRNLSWPEKVRLAARLRSQVKELRQQGPVASADKAHRRSR